MASNPLDWKRCDASFTGKAADWCQGQLDHEGVHWRWGGGHPWAWSTDTKIEEPERKEACNV